MNETHIKMHFSFIFIISYSYHVKIDEYGTRSIVVMMRHCLSYDITTHTLCNIISKYINLKNSVNNNYYEENDDKKEKICFFKSMFCVFPLLTYINFIMPSHYLFQWRSIYHQLRHIAPI